MTTSSYDKEDALRLILVGHCLEAKCDVANSLLKEKNDVKQFACRKQLVTKSKRTVQGKKLHVIVTPNFNTPAWNNSQQDIKKKFNHKVFVYLSVKDNSNIDSDDNYCIKHLKETFRITAGSILTIIYDKVSTLFERETETIVLCQKSTFTEKCKQADRILQRVSETILCSRSPLRPNSSDKVDSKRRSNRKTFDTSIIIVDHKMIESVTIPVDQEFEKQLPELTAEHSHLYQATLATSKARSNHVRVNVMGIQEAGKTTLTQRLQCLDIDCPVSKTKPTEGLNIYHTTLRCMDNNGKREWEWKDGGYEEELNIQRMAFAMKQARDHLNTRQQCQDMEVNALQQTDQSLEILHGSDCVFEETVTVSVQDNASQLELARKNLYLKQVIKRLDDNAKEYMYLSFWDFAGQTTYYTTHQAFMSPAAVYVLVVDLSMDLKDKPKSNIEFRSGVLHEYSVEETLNFLVASITAFTSDKKDGHSPFIIVGTHKDKVTDKEAQKKVEEIRKALNTHAECIFIDNTLKINDDPNLITLRNRLLDLGLGVRDTEISAQWFDLERCIINIKTEKFISSLKDIIKCDHSSDKPMLNETRIKAFLEHQHINGSLLYFGHNELHEIIILDPAKFACLLNKLLRADGVLEVCNGIFDKSIIERIIKNNFQCDQTTIDALIKILKILYIIHPLDLKKDTYFLPCLLPQRTDLGVKAEYREQAPTLRLRFQNTRIPPAFFHTLVSAMNRDDLKIFCDNSSGVSRIFNLYACFYFKKRTTWLEMIWEKSNVYFMLKNFSGTIYLEHEGCDKIIDLIEENVNHVLTTYRQENVKFMIDIQCHNCKQSYVEIQELRDSNEAMCVSKDSIHTVTKRNTGGIYLNSQTSTKREDRVSNVNLVSEKDLGRLARHLTQENPLGLARLLRLYECPVNANNAVQSWPTDENMQRFFILHMWKAQHSDYERNVDHLLKILIKHKDYNIDQLEKIIQDQVECRRYDLEDSILDSEMSDIETCNASSHIGRGYPFLAIELGFSYTDVENSMCNHTNHMCSIINNLLIAWRNKNSTLATIRKLLDAATFVGICNVDNIVTDIKESRKVQ